MSTPPDAIRKRIWELNDLGRAPGPGDYLVIDNQNMCDAKRIPATFCSPERLREGLKVSCRFRINQACKHADRLSLKYQLCEIGQNVTFTNIGPIACMLWVNVNTPHGGYASFKANLGPLAATWNLYGTLGAGDKFSIQILTGVPTLHLSGVDYTPTVPFSNCCDCFSVQFRPLANSFSAPDAGVTINALLTTCPFGYVP